MSGTEKTEFPFFEFPIFRYCPSWLQCAAPLAQDKTPFPWRNSTGGSNPRCPSWSKSWIRHWTGIFSQRSKAPEPETKVPLCWKSGTKGSEPWPEGWGNVSVKQNCLHKSQVSQVSICSPSMSSNNPKVDWNAKGFLTHRFWIITHEGDIQLDFPQMLHIVNAASEKRVHFGQLRKIGISKKKIQFFLSKTCIVL